MWHSWVFVRITLILGFVGGLMGQVQFRWIPPSYNTTKINIDAS